MFRLLIASVILSGLLSLTFKVLAHAEITTIQRTDGSELIFVTQRDASITSKIPIVLFVDGSGCYSARWEKIQFLWALPPWLEGKAASVVVEKPGMEPEMGAPKTCPKTFAKYYSVDQRIFDNLRVIQYLRKHADWWNGEIRLFGWSDGGAMGAHIAAYTPEVVRVVLGVMGGATPMSKQFENYTACAEDRLEEGVSKDVCVETLQIQFAEMRDNPTSSKTWYGNDNTYKAWATRLDQMEYYLFKDYTFPFLIVHGALDRDGTPVQSARLLAEWLRRDGIENFEYWEVPSMGHSFGSLGPERSLKFRDMMFRWLFELPLGEAGPPTFGKRGQ